MSESDANKIVNSGNLRSIALDHNTVAGAERALRSKTANLSVTGAAARLANVTTPEGQVTQQSQASSSSIQVPTVVPSGKGK